MKPRTSWVSTSRAQMTVKSLKGLFPIHFFWPRRVQLSPSRLQVVRMPWLTCEPPSGSVRPNAPIASISSIFGSHSAFCASLPPSAMDAKASPACTPKNTAVLTSTLQASMVNRPSMMVASGVRLPSSFQMRRMKSCFFSSGIRWRGNSSRFQYSFMMGETCACMKPLTSPAKSRCTWVRVSICPKKSAFGVGRWGAFSGAALIRRVRPLSCAALMSAAAFTRAPRSSRWFRRASASRSSPASSAWASTLGVFMPCVVPRSTILRMRALSRFTRRSVHAVFTVGTPGAPLTAGASIRP